MDCAKYIVLGSRQQQMKSKQRKFPISTVRKTVAQIHPVCQFGMYVPTAWPRCENSNQTSARTGRATPMLRVRLRGCYPLRQQSPTDRKIYIHDYS